MQCGLTRAILWHNLNAVWSDQELISTSQAATTGLPPKEWPDKPSHQSLRRGLCLYKHFSWRVDSVRPFKLRSLIARAGCCGATDWSSAGILPQSSSSPLPLPLPSDVRHQSCRECCSEVPDQARPRGDCRGTCRPSPPTSPRPAPPAPQEDPPPSPNLASPPEVSGDVKGFGGV